MSTIVLTSRSGPDGKLHLEIPVGQADAEFEVAVRPMSRAARGWPPGYAALFNSIDDETFVVHPQPPMPPPLEME